MGRFDVCYAAEAGNLHEVKRLIKSGVDIETRDPLRKRTPLHFAAIRDDIDMAKYLCDAGADPDARMVRSGTPLMICAYYGSARVLRLLLSLGVYKAALDYGGWTALHYACNYGRVNCVPHLLEPIATVQSTELRFSPFHLACRSGDVEIIRMLVENGAEVNALAGLKLTPLHMAAQGDHIEACKYLLQQGADPNAEDEAGIKPGRLAKNHELKELLLSA
ncbi:unnamed protein product [Chrysoparadoxa australica]